MPAQRITSYIWDVLLCALWRISLTICLALCAGTSVYAQGGSIYGQVVSPAGYPVANALVRICPTTSTGTPCTPLAANVYADPALMIPVANPYTTDSFGNYSVFVAAGNYYIVQLSFSQNGQAYTYNYIQAAASSSVALSAPQYAIATYTVSPSGTTLGESFVDPTNGILRTDAAGGLYVPGPATFYNTLTGTTITAANFNATGFPGYSVMGSQISVYNLADGVTGTGNVVLAISAGLVTPNIGVARGTSLTLDGLAGSVGQAVCIGAAGLLSAGGCSGIGSVTSFSAGALSPLFTTSVATATTTPALTFALSNAAQNSVFAGPASGGAGAPSYQTAPTISAANMTNFPLATNSSRGLAQCDGTTINCTSGLISQIAPAFTGTSGFQTLPSGLILEWGTTGTLTDNVPVTESFPLTFPHACFVVIPTDSGPRISAGNISTVGAVCASTSTFTVNMADSGETAAWMAVGW